MRNYSNIKNLMLEVEYYGKGILSINFDFSNELIIWRESNRFIGNCTSLMTPEQRNQMIEILNEVSPLDWAHYYPDQQWALGGDIFQKRWKLNLVTISEEIEIQGRDSYPAQYIRLIDIIEQVCHREVEVIE